MVALMHHADLPRTSFSNTLPSLRRRSHCVTSASINEQSGLPNKNRISVFEPYPMRDTVQHFCEKHLDKIKSYMESVCVKIPLPVKCTIGRQKKYSFLETHKKRQPIKRLKSLKTSTLKTSRAANSKLSFSYIFIHFHYLYIIVLLEIMKLMKIILFE